jgi:hypothetical protein
MTKKMNNMMQGKVLYRCFFCLLITGLVFSCNEPEGFKTPEDPLDAGREFVRAVLDGNYEKASLYLLNDQEDIELFGRYQAYMKKQPQKEKLQLKSASIIINKVENQNDSVSIISFSNSYSMKPMDLKVVRSEKTWKVDFKYTFSGNLPLE